MGDAPPADATAPSELGRLVRALGSQRSTGREFLVALLLAGAILLGYGATAGEIRAAEPFAPVV